MIHLSATQMPSSNWQNDIRDGFKHAADLLHYLQLDPTQCDADAEQRFATRVPLSFARRMRKGDANDPLLKQVLASTAETLLTPNFSSDPVGDLPALKHKGLLHKYHGRVLIITTGACAVNCRYCFRRNFPYSENALSSADINHIIDALTADTSISEVILSGGDPLLLSDSKLAQWVQAIAGISHIRRLRIHTRLPIVIPQRVNTTLCTLLSNTRLRCTVVLHSNHANELNDEVADACAGLRQHGITLLNQAVLLKGINDSGQSMAALCESLFNCGVLPYYIHVLDKAAGTAHFEVSASKALAIHAYLQQQLPGYLVPKLVREEAGKAAKTWLR